MKNVFLILFISTLFTITLEAQKTSIGILNIDTEGFNLSPEQMGNMLRIGVEKLDLYEVLDQYDMEYILEQKNINIENCYGKLCLVDIGKELRTDKMIGGKVELVGESIIVTLRLIDVGIGRVEQQKVMEFLDLRNQIQAMLDLSLKSLFEQPFDGDLYTKLTKKYDYENAINTPETRQLNLSGPRMGILAFTGELAQIYEQPLSEGGFDAYPLMSQFGYQFEIKYLNQGDFQALFEFIPMVAGLDQGKFIPSITFLNGMRSNKTGFEIAFGPSFVVSKQAIGYYGTDGNWYLRDALAIDDPRRPEIVYTEKRVDNRGDFGLGTSFVLGIGKSFRSGALNIPVNFFFIPGRKLGHRFGLSAGFNISR